MTLRIKPYNKRGVSFGKVSRIAYRGHQDSPKEKQARIQKILNPRAPTL